MKETEMIKILTVIGNSYSNFTFDRMKVALWLELLKDVSYSRAESNLRRYLIDPGNKFPPHPGVLAEHPGQRSEGNYVPGADETRAMLADRNKNLIQIGHQIPESFREAVKKLADPSTS